MQIVLLNLYFTDKEPETRRDSGLYLLGIFREPPVNICPKHGKSNMPEYSLDFYWLWGGGGLL